MTRVEHIGDAILYLGDCMEVLPSLIKVDHIICDPPYEASLHDSKNSGTVRRRSGPDLKGLNFEPIDAIRGDVVNLAMQISDGWFIAFCTIEGVAKWADEINKSLMKYKRACIWIKPDATPQLNGQGPAQGAECFVTAWCGTGHAKWNAGGKRGVYRHMVNPPDRNHEHPTEKPWRLFAELLTDFTKPGQTVLDPFMGSGTTGIACAKMGRKFVGIEKDPQWFDLARRRLEQAYSQPDFFVTPQPKAIQEALL